MDSFLCQAIVLLNLTVRPAIEFQKDSLVLFQPRTKKKIISYIIVDGDSIPIYQLEQVLVRPLADSTEMARFTKLRRNIKVVLPYAKLAAFKLQLMEDNLRKIEKKKDRRRYVKQVEKSIKKEFMKELQNLNHVSRQVVA